MAIKFDRKKALLRLNADIDELSKLEPDDPKRKQLIEEIEKLNAITVDDGKAKVKENLIKTACIAGLMFLTYGLDRSGVLNKAALSFVPKHI